MKAIRDVLQEGGQLLTETPIWEGEPNNAMLFCPIGEESPYETSSCTFFNEKGLVDTLKSMGFKTVAIEYLGKEGHGRKNDFEMCSNLGNRPPIKTVTRSVFLSTFCGYQKDSFLMKYWERTHDMHSRIGGG